MKVALLCSMNYPLDIILTVTQFIFGIITPIQSVVDDSKCRCKHLLLTTSNVDKMDCFNSVNAKKNTLSQGVCNLLHSKSELSFTFLFI